MNKSNRKQRLEDKDTSNMESNLALSCNTCRTSHGCLCFPSKPQLKWSFWENSSSKSSSNSPSAPLSWWVKFYLPCFVFRLTFMIVKTIFWTVKTISFCPSYSPIISPESRALLEIFNKYFLKEWIHVLSVFCIVTVDTDAINSNLSLSLAICFMTTHYCKRVIWV